MEIQEHHSLVSKLFVPPVEHARLFENKVFSNADWDKHQNALWRHRFEPVICLRVASGFIWQLAFIGFLAVLVTLYVKLLVPRGAPALDSDLAAPFNMISFALSLLLVFKTNSSYSRWWEARTIWGQIVNYARNYSRLVLVYFPPEAAAARASALRWAIAGPKVLMLYLRERKDWEAVLGDLLDPAELAWVRSSPMPPYRVAALLSGVVAQHAAGTYPGVGGMSTQLVYQLEEQVSLFVNMAGGCERILKTPIPSAYTRHTSRFLMTYLCLAPLLLVNGYGWTTAAVAMCVAFLLLGTENIGVRIEEPFRVLPLEAICSAIERNVKEMEQQHNQAHELVKQASSMPALVPPTLTVMLTSHRSNSPKAPLSTSPEAPRD